MIHVAVAATMTGDAWFDHAQIGQTLYQIGVAG